MLSKATAAAAHANMQAITRKLRPGQIPGAPTASRLQREETRPSLEDRYGRASASQQNPSQSVLSASQTQTTKKGGEIRLQ